MREQVNIARTQAALAQREAILLNQARIKALEAKIAETVLRKDVPSLEELEAIHLPSFRFIVVNDNVFPPLGPDDAPDLRFLQACRPPAEKLATRLRTLPFSVCHREKWIAVSGCGKTSAIFQVGREFYTMYIPCIPKALVDANTQVRTLRETSGTFVILENAILQETARNFRRHPNDDAKRLSAVFIVSHFFILLLFLTKFPTATPIEYLYFQLSEAVGQDCVKIIFDHLSNLTLHACEYLARSIRVKLRDHLNHMSKSPHVLLAIDESAANRNESFLSCTNKPKRGILSPLLQAIRDLQGASAYSIIICGTETSYERAPSGTSNIGKGEIHIMPDFYLANEQAVISMLKKLPGVDDECIHACSSNITYLVDTRYSLLTRTVEEFYKLPVNNDTISFRLNTALQSSIAGHKQSLMIALQDSIMSHPDKSVVDLKLSLLHKVYLAAQLTNGRMEFMTTDMDLCRLGLGAVLNSTSANSYTLSG